MSSPPCHPGITNAAYTGDLSWADYEWLLDFAGRIQGLQKQQIERGLFMLDKTHWRGRSGSWAAYVASINNACGPASGTANPPSPAG